MCNCAQTLQTQLAGTPRGNRIIKQAAYIAPRIRLSYAGCSLRESITIDVPYCPFCGNPKRTSPLITKQNKFISMLTKILPL